MVAKEPGLIARCADMEDVQKAVRAGTETGVETAVRCGGHSLAGFSTCDGGLVIDLSAMRAVTVDASARRAKFSGGCLLGDIDRATQREGLAFPAGVVSHTGAAGLALGGGTGWLNRLHGLSCDNVEGFQVVVADGSVVRANARKNEDLFWALRGGGGNFGVVCEFEVKLYPVRAVLLGTCLRAGDDIRRSLRAWREFMKEAPDNLRWGISLTKAPESEEVPRQWRGKPVASESALWVGDLEKGRLWLDRVLSPGKPIARRVKEMPFLELQTMADHEFPHGRRYYTKAGYFAELRDESIETMIGSLETMPSAASQIELAYLGGAAGRVSTGETAFGDRSSPFIVNLLGNWSDAREDDANREWIRALFAALRPAMTPGVYVNFMSGDEQERVHEAYHARWDRLLAIKREYDPENFFRRNQNIVAMK